MIEPCEEVKRVEQRYEKALDDMEKHYKDVFDKIRDEIDGIEINGQVDEHTMFIRTGEQVKKMALEIIDHYMKGE